MRYWTSDNGETRLEIHQGDALAVLRTLPSESVHCCVTSPPYFGLRAYLPTGHPDKPLEVGLEDSLEEYVARLVSIFAEVKRVLRKDGTCWVNLGDSYNTANSGRPNGIGSAYGHGTDKPGHDRPCRQATAVKRSLCGLKPKDLCGVPWRVAFALQADGWYLRSDVIWSKLNPMPESVTDRPTKAHEYLFLLAKSDRYFYDAEAVREPHQDPRVVDGHYPNTQGFRSGGKGIVMKDRDYNPGGRNRRTVWTIATEAFPEAHFATFPTALVEPCIKAGTSEKGCCPKCGAPWVRIVEKQTAFAGGSGAAGRDPDEINASGKWQASALRGNHNLKAGPVVTTTTQGWRQSCSCDCAPPAPCIVMDPFGGSGTVPLVAQRLGRSSIMVDLNPDYCGLAQRRCEAEHKQMRLAFREEVV